MAVYTVHVPRSSGGEAPPPEKVVFLRDGFSVPAFVFGPFWLAWRKAWLAAAAWTLLLAAIAGAGVALGLPRAAISIVEFAASLVLGFEGSQLVSWTLARRGFVESAVTVADDLDEAEEVFFNSWRPGAAGVAAAPRAAGSGVAATSPGSHVVGGLFEEPRS
ncbi:MAG: hypothetical protein C3F11_08000 [Methylocystaceae bacterium]|nr:MAG: hypothetical protein C3F11_08000 [Methylocystaceae bacterium]